MKAKVENHQVIARWIGEQDGKQVILWNSFVFCVGAKRY